jgi:hypothetical protein
MKTTVAKSEILARATTFFGRAGYYVRSQTVSSIIFQDGKEINWVLFVVLFFFTALIGVLIYWIIAGRRQIIISIMPVDGMLDVLVAGNNRKSHQLADSFMKTLPQA